MMMIWILGYYIIALSITELLTALLPTLAESSPAAPRALLQRQHRFPAAQPRTQMNNRTFTPPGYFYSGGQSFIFTLSLYFCWSSADIACNNIV